MIKEMARQGGPENIKLDAAKATSMAVPMGKRRHLLSYLISAGK